MAVEELERANLERARARAALPNEVRCLRDQIKDDNAHRMAEERAVLTQEVRDEINHTWYIGISLILLILKFS